jgi:hypothetical protein
MSGFPNQWEVRTRNRHHSNQPGSLAKPEQEMMSEMSLSNPESTHMMRMQADALRSESDSVIEDAMNYSDSNQPDIGENYAYAPDE